MSTVKSSKYVEIMDTTLRDGEQTPGISFTPAEKKQIARILLEKVKVDRIEIASARVSEGEHQGAKSILEWADRRGKLERCEILGFVDEGKSVDWICDVGGKVINLLTKGSETHCIGQLGKTPQEHYKDVCAVIEYAKKQELKVNVYLEDWSNGMRNGFQYVYAFMREISRFPIDRVMLPDTLGVLNPLELERYLSWMITSFPEIGYDFHGHNDYGLGTANCLKAADCGINGVHVTVNGLGERAGNPSLCEVVAVIHDMSWRRTRARESQLDYVANVVETISGKRLSANSPITGSDVFTQTCGVHADGDKKGDLYVNPLLPNRFGRKRRYALGKLAGKASIDKNLEVIGMELEPEVRDQVLREVIRLGDKKKKVTPEDLPFIISDVLKSAKTPRARFLEYEITTQKGKMPTAKIVVEIDDRTLNAEAKGDGGYDAFMKALRKCVKPLKLAIPKLVDYEVRIPPGGKADALVETMITWDQGKDEAPLVTIGIDSDQVEAAIEATERMLNTVLVK